MNQITSSAIKLQSDPHLYKGKDGTVYLGFGKTQNVIQLDLILPASLQGLSYDEVKTTASIRQYFELANMVLISAEAMQTYLQSLDMTGVTKANPAKVHVPPFDLDHLRLREPDGKLWPKRLQSLFTVVAAYWEHTPKLGLKTGLVAGLWRRGMSASDIIRSLEISTGPDGQLVKATGRGHDIMSTVIDVYIASNGLPGDSEISQAEMAGLVESWLSATRSAPLGTQEGKNTVLHWSEYRRLGLIDQAGVAQIDQVRRVAEQVFLRENVTYSELEVWVDQSASVTSKGTDNERKVAQAMMKKKRKQGRLNRKRGRR